MTNEADTWPEPTSFDKRSVLWDRVPEDLRETLRDLLQDEGALHYLYVDWAMRVADGGHWNIEWRAEAVVGALLYTVRWDGGHKYNGLRTPPAPNEFVRPDDADPTRVRIVRRDKITEIRLVGDKADYLLDGETTAVPYAMARMLAWLAQQR